jgi:predicted phosphodiesterase
MNNWDPGPAESPDSTDLALSKLSNQLWQIKVLLEDRKTYQYKFTRGSLQTLENNTDSTETNLRSVFIDSELDPIIVLDTVYSWKDFTLPPKPENGTPVLSYFNNSPQTALAITWGTDSLTTNTLYYGINDINENVVTVNRNYDMLKAGDNLIHTVRLENLQPGTTYKYKVETRGVYESPEYNFKTAGYTDKFEFAVMGDNRPGIDTLVMQRVINNKSEFVIHLGDLVQNGKKLSDWFVFFRNYSKMLGNIPTMAIYGNHEEDALLNRFFNFPGNGASGDNNGHWYSFNYNNVHFTALDPYRHYYEGSEQYNWIIDDLNSISENIDHVIVLIHEPPFTSGTHHGPNLEIRGQLVPVFEKYNVDVVFTGHEHIYERSVVNGIPYITSGGAGSPLYFVAGGSNEYSVIAESVYHYCRVFIDGKNIKIQMVRSNGTIGDEFEIIKEITNEIPDRLILGQNYPNPFNPSTRIKFGIAEPLYVTLKVYDILGQLAGTLITENLLAGIYEVELDASKLSTGVYIYKLTAGDSELVKKLLVLK